MKRIILPAIIWIIITQSLLGQEVTKGKIHPDRVDSSSVSIKGVIIPAPFIIAGISLYGKSGERFQQLRQSFTPNFKTTADNYLRFAPSLLLYSLKISGVESRSTWGRLLATNALSAIIVTGSVNAIKRVVKEPRPDGSESDAFPSGHTAIAFMGAHMVHKEFGHKSPWYTVAAYSAASATAVLRVLNNKHYVHDVIMGAGMGIISTELGYIFGGLIFRDRGLLNNESAGIIKDVSNSGYSFTGIGLEYQRILNKISIDGSRYYPATGTGISLESIYYIPSLKIKSSNFGIHLSGNSGTTIGKKNNLSGSDININTLSLSLGPALSLKVGNIMRFGVTAEAGYSRLSLVDIQSNEKNYNGFYTGASLFCEREIINGILLRVFTRNRNSFHPKPAPDLNTISVGGSMSISLY